MGTTDERVQTLVSLTDNSEIKIRVQVSQPSCLPEMEDKLEAILGSSNEEQMTTNLKKWQA